MEDEERAHLIDAVQRQIAFLLADLERRAGGYVEGISIASLDITRLENLRHESLRAVRIDFRHAGAKWAT